MPTDVARFLDLIAWSEGTSTSSVTRDRGYDVIVSGPAGPERCQNYLQHPFAGRPPKLVRPGLSSTAAGRYQVLYRYWTAYAQRLRLPDFSPASQDAVAVQQLRECGALKALVAGDVAGAIRYASAIWASLPGNDYGQGGHTTGVLLAQWQAISEVPHAVSA